MLKKKFWVTSGFRIAFSGIEEKKDINSLKPFQNFKNIPTYLQKNLKISSFSGIFILPIDLRAKDGTQKIEMYLLHVYLLASSGTENTNMRKKTGLPQTMHCFWKKGIISYKVPSYSLTSYQYGKKLSKKYQSEAAFTFLLLLLLFDANTRPPYLPITIYANF